ncbi:MAG: PPC domain-containing protein [Planctomycetes bacterium]|nr:PPC domain-containing protein [Planctomycetota bacterium]
MRRAVAPLLALALLPAAARAQQDRFEPNQTRRTAARIEPGDYKGLFCNDEDWYAVDVPAGQRLEVQVKFSHAQADLELEAQDGRGRVLAWSRGQKDEEALALVPLAAGPVYVRVHGGSAPYDLHLGVAPAGARGPAGGRTAQAVCWGSDWYPVEVAAGQRVRAELSFRHADGDLDLGILAADGKELADSSGDDDREEVTWTAREAALVLVHVRHVHRARSPYTLRLEVGAAAAPDLAQVLRVERPEGRGRDLLELRSGDVLEGTVLNESFTIVTAYAQLEVPAARVAGLDLERRVADVEAIVTVDEDRFSGFIRTERLRVKLPALAEPVEIRRERLVRVVFGRRGDERRAPPLDGHRVVLHSGDEFTGRARAGSWTLDLGFAALPLALDQVESLAFEGEGVVSLVRPDRTVLRGRLDTEVIEVELSPGDRPVVVRLHPDRLAFLRRGGGGAGALGPAELLQVLRQLAPAAPRALVRELTEGGAIVERVNQLRPLVAVREEGCPPLLRHVLALDDRPAQYAWLQVLLRVDRPLRDRLVRLCGEDHEDRKLRLGAAQALVDLAGGDGPVQPLEQVCSAPVGAELVFGIIMATNDDVLMQRLMPLMRGGWRGARGAEAPGQREKDLLLEALPRLLDR